MEKPPVNRYQEVALQTASVRQLMVMTHERALGCLRQAIAQFERGDVAGHRTLLHKGRALVLQAPELLDLESGGELVAKTCSLYVYVNRRLLFADLRKDLEPIREAITLLDNMLAVWRGSPSGAQTRGEP